MSIATDAQNQSSQRQRSGTKRTVLMCSPDYFTVIYRINPWMDPALPTDTSLALEQWRHLYQTYLDIGHEVRLIDPVPGLPDMVYAANGAFVVNGVAYGARFNHPERTAEAPAYAAWLSRNGFDVREPVAINEGEGDFLLVGDVILAGTGFRSEVGSHAELAEIFHREVITLTLANPSFYHLDTAIAVLDATPGQEQIAYLPDAFDERSREVLRERYPGAIIATAADAAVLGMNAFSDGYNVVVSASAHDFARQLSQHGYNPIGVDMSELLRGGGGVKCCTLELRS